jgi:hypothetical protein
MTEDKYNDKAVIGLVNGYKIKTTRYIDAWKKSDKDELISLAAAIEDDLNNITKARLYKDQFTMPGGDGVRKEMKKLHRKTSRVISFYKDEFHKMLEDRFKEKDPVLDELLAGIGIHGEQIYDEQDDDIDLEWFYEKLLDLESYTGKKIIDVRLMKPYQKDIGDAILEVMPFFDFEGFLKRLDAPGLILSNKPMPSTLVGYFGKIRSCYAFEQYEAAIIFCRALLEEAYQVIYGRELGDIKLGHMHEAAEKKGIKLTGDIKKIKNINDRANNILHESLKNIEVKKHKFEIKETGVVKEPVIENISTISLKAIDDTIWLVENSFRDK